MVHFCCRVTSFTLVWIKIHLPKLKVKSSVVTSFTLVWIKIFWIRKSSIAFLVTSFTLVWIKITIQL